MGKAEREKGKRTERAAVKQVRKSWRTPECIRSAQAGGAFAADLLKALPCSHVEVKGRKKIAALRFMEQALKDRSPKGPELPLVLMREDHRPGFVVMFGVEDSFGFAARLLANYLVHDPERAKALERVAKRYADAIDPEISGVQVD